MTSTTTTSNSIQKRTTTTTNSATVVESVNDQMTKDLSKKVGKLRSLSIEIGEELAQQNNFLLHDVDSLATHTHASMVSTGNKVQQLLTTPGTFSGCFYLILISVAVCSTFWLLLKTR